MTIVYERLELEKIFNIDGIHRAIKFRCMDCINGCYKIKGAAIKEDSPACIMATIKISAYPLRKGRK